MALTNAEKFKEIFGIEPDATRCPFIAPSKCHRYDKGFSWCDQCDFSEDNWWFREYHDAVSKDNKR